MSYLESRLADLARTAETEPDDTTVESDLARAQGAWRRRRNRRAQVVSFGALATLGVVSAVALGVGAQSDSERAGRPPSASTSDVPGSTTPSPAPSSSPSPVTQPTPPSGPATTGGDVRLVAYAGPQTAGFDVTAIPDGFVLQGADNVSLAVARPGNRTGIFDFEHKIVVTAELVDVVGPLDPRLTQIEVRGKAGTVRTGRDGTITLRYQLDDERIAFVQAWKDVGISEQQLVRFADSLTISDDVETVS